MKKFLGVCVVLCMSSAQAQNLVQNPNFDQDATGWDLSMFTTWSNRVDHGDSPLSGALQISTRDADSARQCIELRGSTAYAVSMWVEKDPQPDIAPCATPNNHIQIELRSAAQCGGSTTLYFGSIERLPEPEGWQHFMGEITTQDTTRSALVTLSGSCDAKGTGISIHYFDDIFIAPDSIFATDFEQHATEGGPSQPPGG
ncbi:MAG: hypothetical protein ABJB01_00975 [Rudaea sp.]